MQTKTVKIVGCGLAGATAAAVLKEKGYRTIIFESRSHIGGNCYDCNVNGVMLHNYGPHIFHTNNDEAFNFLSNYTEWIPFEVKPKGKTKLGTISLPYSKKTRKELGRDLTFEELADLIYKDYSEKQWGIPYEDLPKSIISKLPNTSDLEDPTWFGTQKHQCLPKKGYTAMFENMLDGIEVKLNCSKNDWIDYPADLTIYTGRIDEYFKFCFGKLPYRSLKFKHEVTSEKMPHFLENSNTHENQYTRKYDHSYFTPGHNGITVITEEYPITCGDNDIPYYPLSFNGGPELYQKYKELAQQEKDVIFTGTLATYAYLDMALVVGQVLSKIKNVTL
jgi:UDP-galactopyranose mutase